jgi:glyoxylase I family protein
MKPVAQLHHVSIIVSDTERALDFYRDVLGLETDDRRPDLGYPGAWLQLGEAQIHLLELPNPDPVSGRPEHGGRDRHFALTVAQLEPVIQALQTAGIAHTLSRSGRRALFCRDPDGNAVEIIEQRVG